VSVIKRLLAASEAGIIDIFSGGQFPTMLLIVVTLVVIMPNLSWGRIILGAFLLKGVINSVRIEHKRYDAESI
jgi:hypothetical protein